MDAERAALEAAVAALQAQRATLGDAVVDIALAPLLQRLARRVPAGESQRLRLVSVLFADVTGSTTLARALTPEDMHEILGVAMDRFAEVVQAQGGRVLQYAGDGLLAAFGADAVQEDDAARAVRCALALVQAAEGQRERVRQRFGHDGFGLRAGVHTGPVLLAAGRLDESSIRGITVHLAARMEQSAPPGSVRISQQTWRQVRGLFDAEAQPPLQVKGQDEPMRTWLVRGLAPRAGGQALRGVDGLAPVPMVGRRDELARLREAWQAVAQDGRLRVVRLSGEAGIGKTRLLAALREAVVGPAWSARGQEHGRPLGLLRDLVVQALALDETAEPEALRCQFEAAALPLLLPRAGDAALARGQAQVLGQLIGLDFAASAGLQGLADDAMQVRARALHALRELVRGAAAPGAPVLVLLDDLQASDDDSRELLATWLRGPAEVPALVVLAARPVLAEQDPDWPRGLVPAATLALVPLDATEATQLADALLQRLPEPGPVRELLLAHAGGNPYFMEELLNMLVDAGALDASGERWALVPGRLDTAQVPGTLTGLLQARLDALPAPERRPLQRAAVLGVRFWAEALAALSPEAAPALPALRRRGLLEDRGEPGDGLQAWAFVQALMQRVAHDTLLRAERTEAHRLAAGWIEARPAAWARAQAGALAAHWEAAGEDARAAAAYAEAAEQAAAQFAHGAVIRCADRVLALAAPEAAALRRRAHLVRQRSLRLAGRLDEQWTDLDALEALAAGDDAERARVLLRRAVAQSEAGDLPATVQGARAALALAGPAGADAVAISAHAALAGALRVLGPPAEALRVAREGLALARRVGPPSAVSEMLNVLAAAASEGGDHAAAEAMLSESLAIDQAGGSRFAEVTTLINLGECRTRLARLDEAAVALDRAAPMAQALGMRNAHAMATLNRSNLERLRGRADEAAALAAAARDAARATGNREYEALAWLALGQAALERADPAAAARAFEAMLALLEATGMTAVAAEPRAGLALAALQAGRPAEALALIEPVLADPAAGRGYEGCQQPLWIRHACARVLAATGDPRASAAAHAAHEDLERQAAALPDAAARAAWREALPLHRAVRAAWPGPPPEEDPR